MFAYKCNSGWFPFVEVSSPGIFLEFRTDVFNLSYAADNLYLVDGRALKNVVLEWHWESRSSCNLWEVKRNCITVIDFTKIETFFSNSMGL